MSGIFHALMVSHIIYGLLTVITLSTRPFTPWIMYLIPYAVLLILLRKLFNFRPALSMVLPLVSGMITLKLFLLYVPSYEASLKLYFPYSLSSIYYDGRFVKAPSSQFTHINFPLTILFITIAEIVCKSETTVTLHFILSSITIYICLLQITRKFRYKEPIDEITKITASLLLSYLVLDFYWQELRFSYRTLSYLFAVLTSILLLRFACKRKDMRKSTFSDILVLAILTNSIAFTDLTRFIMFTVTLCIILLILRSKLLRSTTNNTTSIMIVPAVVILVTPGITWIAYNSTAYITHFVSYIKVIFNDIKAFIVNIIYSQKVVIETLETFKESYRGTLYDLIFAIAFNSLFCFSQLLIIFLFFYSRFYFKKVYISPCSMSIKILSIPATIILIGYLTKVATAYTGTLRTSIGDISDVIIRFYIPTLSALLILLLLYQNDQNEGNLYHQDKVILHTNRIEKY